MIRPLIVVFVGSSIVGCGATSNSSFVDKAVSLSDLDVCYNYVEDNVLLNQKEIDDPHLKIYARKLSDEVTRRKLSLSGCNAAVKNKNDKNRKIAVVTALVGAVAYVAYRSYKKCKKEKNCSNNMGYSSSQGRNNSQVDAYKMQAFEENYDWDFFYDAGGNLIYRCRSKQTGKFLPNETCAHLQKDDSTWPTKLNEPFVSFIQ
jgi:hypothetical protein